MGKGRGTQKNEFIENSRSRRYTFKKRRIGVLKKCMELSVLSDCDVELKIYFKEDKSLLEYRSSNNEIPNLSNIDEYALFQNKDFDLCMQAENLTVKSGNMFTEGEHFAN